MNAAAIPFLDRELLARYERAGPRYTSYPPADRFTPAFGEAAWRKCVADSNHELIPKPLSLYFHIPFCSTVCFYCACNKIITGNRKRADDYIVTLLKELRLQRALIDPDRQVAQIHFGGGTPNFLSLEQIRTVFDAIRGEFQLQGDALGEYSIELDPRGVDAGYIQGLREVGFNRMSIGVQDLDPGVGAAVNRVNDREQIEGVIRAARDAGFRSINVDLIYGLPLQTVSGFATTLDRVVAMRPDRLSIFNYAHLPDRFKVQRQIHAEDLPSAAQRLDILDMAIGKLGDHGFVHIGMDHFARPEDELALAQAQGGLHRNFQGYSTHGDADLIAMGITAISNTADCYAQNSADIDEWKNAIESGYLPIVRGIQLDAEDQLRGEIIGRIICGNRLDIAAIEDRWGIDFEEHFSAAVAGLDDMAEDGLLARGESVIEVLPAGRLLLRNICMLFDPGLTGAQRYSKTV